MSFVYSFLLSFSKHRWRPQWVPVCSRDTKVTEQSSPEELPSGRGGGGGDAPLPHCRVSVLRDGHREGRVWEPSLTPGEALFRRMEEGANSVKETGKSGWRAGRRAKMAESSSPLTCAGPGKHTNGFCLTAYPLLTLSAYPAKLVVSYN